MNLVAVGGRLGRVVGGEVELLDLPVADVSQLVRRPDWRTELAVAAVIGRVALDAAELDTPVRPGSFWLVGSNYAGRAAQAPARPAFYLRAASSVSGPRAEVSVPEGLEVEPDGEVAVVIGETAWRVTESDAWRYVAGVTACNDLTARALLDGGKGTAVAKSLPGFGALGASVRIVDGDPGPLEVSMTIDGATRQRGATDEMFAGIAELVARLSELTRLLPGDVIATGAPALVDGVASGPVAGGETAVVEVSGVLPLETRLVSA